MSKVFQCVAMVFLSACFSAPSGAADSKAERARKPAETIEVETLEALELKHTYGDVRAWLSGLHGRPEGKGLEQIRLIGRGKGKRSEKGHLGKVIWYGLELQHKNRKLRTGLSAPLESALIARQPVVPAQTEVQAKGDVKKLLKEVL